MQRDRDLTEELEAHLEIEIQQLMERRGWSERGKTSVTRYLKTFLYEVSPTDPVVVLTGLGLPPFSPRSFPRAGLLT